MKIFTKWLMSFFLALFLAFPLSAQINRCPICGMEVRLGKKAGFESSREGKPIQLCSFVCTTRLHMKNPTIPITVIDYVTGQKIDSKKAYFLVRSTQLLKEIEFEMPPTVVAFASQENAEKTQERLKDGKVVFGFDAAEKEFR